MLVHIPSPLRSYTGNKSEVQADGSSVDNALSNLDKTYPGIRFRMIDEQGGIREHIKLYVNREQIKSINTALKGSEEIHIICALSGG
ncbi:MAG: MoaD/ThiS family protein [Candidatus Obscuribacterales bacterium]|nr:MoaD/ThiS family protein [Candidatus Obscuribacterales bacterium]